MSANPLAAYLGWYGGLAFEIRAHIGFMFVSLVPGQQPSAGLDAASWVSGYAKTALGTFEIAGASIVLAGITDLVFVVEPPAGDWRTANDTWSTLRTTGLSLHAIDAWLTQNGGTALRSGRGW